MNSTQTAGIHSIDHFALNVPSIEEASKFLVAYGLDVQTVGEGNEIEVRARDGHLWARVLKADRKSLAYLCLSCYEGDLQQIRKQVQACGANFISGPPESESRGFLCFDPDGNVVQVKVGVKTSPYCKIAGSPLTVPGNCRGSEAHALIKQVRPRRLSHVAIFTPNVARALSFYEGGLGLRVSDRVEDLSAFTYARHGCDHHLIALAKSGARGMHHFAWDVADINEVGKGGAQMAAAGYKKGWGTGRHVLGSNYFHYVMDPWGSFWEYCADIDFIAGDGQWVSAENPAEDGLYQWGPDVPEYFLQNSEATL